MSTSAPATGAHAELEFTTLIVSVSAMPWRSSRMSLRIRLVTEGNGPAVSLGVTAQAGFDDVGSVVVVAAADGDVAELLQPNAAAALTVPISVIASRLPIFVCFIISSWTSPSGSVRP